MGSIQWGLNLHGKMHETIQREMQFSGVKISGCHSPSLRGSQPPVSLTFDGKGFQILKESALILYRKFKIARMID